MRKTFTTLVRRTATGIALGLASVSLLFANESILTAKHPLIVHAAPAAKPDYAAEAEARKEIPIESNSFPGWPKGPIVSADAAILMDAETGTILYAKNIYAAEYPASTTKLLTGLIAYETCSMDEQVYFSDEAIGAITWDSSNMAAKPGEVYSMEQSLYGLLVGSANESANAIGEHISGTMADFALLMNERASELGCVNSHFVNANGLWHEDHYTCAYDLATIARAFFGHEILCKMSSTYSYQIAEENIIRSHNKLLPDCTYEYPYLVGSKTGYTDKARQTLVTCAQKDGMKLICVVLKEESPSQFTDTIDLLNYGFSNFKKYNVSEYDQEYNIQTYDFFQTDNDVFGSSQPILSLDRDASIILPITADFADAEKSIIYEETNSGRLATIVYQYQGMTVGTCSILINPNVSSGSVNADVADGADGSEEYGSEMGDPENDYNDNPEQLGSTSDGSGITDDATSSDTATKKPKTIYINIKHVLYWVLGVLGALIVVFIIIKILKSYHFGFFDRRRRIKRSRQSRKSYNRYHGKRR